MGTLEEVLAEKRKQQADGTYQSVAGQNKYNTTLKDMQPSQKGMNTYLEALTPYLIERDRIEKRNLDPSAAIDAANKYAKDRETAWWLSSDYMRDVRGDKYMSQFLSQQRKQATEADAAAWLDYYGYKSDGTRYTQAEREEQKSRNAALKENDEKRAKYAGMSLADIERERDEQQQNSGLFGILQQLSEVVQGSRTAIDFDSTNSENTALYYDFDEDGNAVAVNYNTLIGQRKVKDVYDAIYGDNEPEPTGKVALPAPENRLAQMYQNYLNANTAADNIMANYNELRNKAARAAEGEYTATEIEAEYDKLIRDVNKTLGTSFTKEDDLLSDYGSRQIEDAVTEWSQKQNDAFKQATGVTFKDLEDYERAQKNRKTADKLAKYAQIAGREMPIFGTALSLAAGTLIPAEYLDNLSGYAQKNPLLPGGNVYDDYATILSGASLSGAGTAVADDMRSMGFGESTANLMSNVYTGAVSGAQSIATMTLASAIFGPAVGSYVGGAVLYAQAAQNAYRTTILNGGTPTGALVYSFAAGLNEMLFEKLSFSNLGAVKRALEQTGKLAWTGGLKSFLAKSVGLVADAAIEGTEEGFTDLANYVADGIINGDLSEYNTNVARYKLAGYSDEQANSTAMRDFLQQLLESYIGGMVGGAVGSAVNTGVTAVHAGANAMQQAARRNAEARAAGAELRAAGADANLIDIARNATKENRELTREQKKAQRAAQKAQKASERAAGINIQGDSGSAAYRRAEARQNLTLGRLQEAVMKSAAAGFDSVSAEMTRNAVRTALSAQSETVSDRAVDAAVKLVNSEKLTKSDTRALAGMDAERIVREVNAARQSPEFRTEYASRTQEAKNSAAAALGVTEKDMSARISDSGSAEVISTGKEVKLGKIVRKELIKEGHDKGSYELVFATEDGGEVKASAVKYANAGQAAVYETLARSGLSVNAMNYVAAAYDAGAGVSANVYVRGMIEGYNYGLMGTARGNIRNAAYYYDLTQTQQDVAYRLGAQARQEQSAAATERNEKREKKAKKAEGKGAKAAEYVRKGEIAGKFYDAEGRVVTFDEYIQGENTALTSRQIASVALLSRLQRMGVGGNIYYYETGVNEKGESVFRYDVGGHKAGTATTANGWYDPKTGDVYLDLSAGDLREGSVLWTAGHEFTHMISDRSPEAYEKLQRFLAEELGADLEKEVEEYADFLRQRKYTEDDVYAYALEEVVANAMSGMLTDAHAAEHVAKLRQYDEGLYSEIEKWILALSRAVDAAYAELSGRLPGIAQEVLALEKQKVDEVARLFAEGLVSASDNVRRQSAGSSNTNTSAQKTNRSLRNSEKESARNPYEDYDKPITREDIENLRRLFPTRKSVNAFTSEEIQATQKWAHKYWQQMGTKSPFFRAWFGDWRAYDKSPIKKIICNKKNFSAGSAYNSDMQERMSWNKDSLRESVINSNKDFRSVMTVIASNMDGIVENAVLFGSETSGKDSKRKMEDTAFMHQLYAVAEVDGKQYLVKLFAEEALSRNGEDFTRAYSLKNIEVAAEIDRRVISGTEALPYSHSAASIEIISDLYNFVKKYDKSFSSGAEVNPAMLNADGTPKIMYHGTKSDDFHVFDRSRAGSNYDGYNAAGGGFDFTDTEDRAMLWGAKAKGSGKVRAIPAYLNAKKTFYSYNGAVDAELESLLPDSMSKKQRAAAMESGTAFKKALEDSGINFAEAIQSLGYDSYAMYPGAENIAVYNPEQIKSATDNVGTFDKENPDIRFSERMNVTAGGRELAPVFYSQLERAIGNMKMDKIGASSVISFLKGRGVKDEEIKWSGIVPFLQGKKSVTKAELQRVMDENRIQIKTVVKDMEYDSNNYDDYRNAEKKALELARQKIVDEGLGLNLDALSVDYNGEGDFDVTSTETGEVVYTYEAETRSTNWSDYRLHGGGDYREYVYTLSGSDYTNTAMRTHWMGIKGVVAHARVQDFYTSDGERVLFVEEIQSDWHNAGQKGNFVSDELINHYSVEKIDLENKSGGTMPLYRLLDESGEIVAAQPGWLLEEKGVDLNNDDKIRKSLISAIPGSRNTMTPDAPYAGEADSYVPFVLKNLIREAAEEGYDRIGWTTAQQQADRWSDAYMEGYRIEYDQEIPKFLKKYGKQWGAQVEDIELNTGDTVHSMTIPDAMKESVLYEGQLRFSEKNEAVKQKVLDKSEQILAMYDITKISDYVHVQKQVNKTLRKNGFFTNPDGVSRTEKNKETGMIININQSGIRETFNLNNYSHNSKAVKLAKLLTIEKIPEVIANGHLPSDDNANVHGNTPKYAYLEGTVEAEGIEFSLRLAIRQAAQGNRFWVHYVDMKKTPMEQTYALSEDKASLRTIGVENDDSTTPAGSQEENSGVEAAPAGESMDERYQYKGNPKSTAMDQRMLLSNALYAAAQDAGERSLVDSYQEASYNIQKLTEERYDLLRQIDGMQYRTEGTGERVRRTALSAGEQKELSRMKEKLAKLNDKIQKYDRKLLNLYAMTPMKELVTQAREQIYAKTAESRATADLKRRINIVREDFMKRLSTKGDTFVPPELAQAVIDVCNMVDTGAKEGTKAREKYLRAKEGLQDLRLAYAKILSSPNSDLQSEYDASLEQNLDMLTEKVGNKRVNEMTRDELEDVYTILNDIRRTVRDAAKQIGRAESITNAEAAQNIIANQEEVARLGLNSLVKGKAAKLRLDKYRAWMTNPMRIAHLMAGYDTNSELYKLMEELSDGVRKMNTFIMDSNKPFEQLRGNDSTLDKKALTKKESAALRKRYETSMSMKRDWGLLDTEGKPLLMTEQQAMQLILTWEREAVNPQTEHLRYQTIIPDAKIQAKGNPNDAIAKGQKLGMVDYLTIVRLTEQMDDWANKYMDAARHFFRVESANAVNEATMITKHRPVATTRNYIPFEVAQDYVAKESENVKIDASIAAIGSLKSVVRYANNPLVMRGLAQIVDKHMNDAGKIYGLMVPVRNLNKALNYRESVHHNMTPKSVKDVLRQTWLSDMYGVLDQAIADVQGNRRKDTPKIVSKIKSGWVQATLASNISVAMKQAASYPTAASVIKWESLAKGLGQYFITRHGGENGMNLQEVYAEMDTHTPYGWMRRQGLSMPEISDFNQSKDWKRLGGKANPMNWIQSVDVATTAAIWYAAKDQVRTDARKSGQTLSEDEYWQRVTELYEKALDATQPMYDPLHRAEISKNSFTSNIIMFQTQPLQNAGILFEAAHELKAAKARYGKGSAEVTEAGHKFVRAIVSQLASHMVFAGMTLAAAALTHRMNPYRDDDDELHAESILPEVGLDLLESVLGAIFPVAGTYAYNIGKMLTDATLGHGKNAFDVFSDPLVDQLNDIITTLSNTFSKVIGPLVDNDKETKPEITVDSAVRAASKVLSLAGIPAANAWNIAYGAYQHLQDIIKDGKLSFEAGVNRTAGAQGRRAYEAILAGDAKKQAEILAEVGDEKKYHGYVKQALVDYNEKVAEAAQLRLDKKYNDAMAIGKELIEAGFTHADVVGAINTVYNKLYKAMNGEEEPEAYDPDAGEWISSLEKREYIYESYLIGNPTAIDDAISLYDDEKAAQKGYRLALKEHYLAGDIDDSEAMDMLMNGGAVETEKKAHFDYVEKWKYIRTNDSDDGYGALTKLREAVLSGQNWQATIREYLDYGYDYSDMKSNLTSIFKPLYLDAKTDDAKEAIVRKVIPYYEMLGVSEEEERDYIRKHWK